MMKNQQDLGSVSCVSIILHHLLKELPIEVVSSNVVQILHLIEFSKDNSFDQVYFCNFYHTWILLVHIIKYLPFYLIIEASSFKFFQFAVLMFFFFVIQHMNYRLLGFRLYERKSPVDIVDAVLDKVIQVFVKF